MTRTALVAACLLATACLGGGAPPRGVLTVTDPADSATDTELDTPLDDDLGSGTSGPTVGDLLDCQTDLASERQYSTELEREVDDLRDELDSATEDVDALTAEVEDLRYRLAVTTAALSDCEAM